MVDITSVPNTKRIKNLFDDLFNRVEILEEEKNKAKILYDLIGTYVQDGKMLTKEEWEKIGVLLGYAL